MMDPEMAEKIEAILQRVKDPESGLPVSRLGVIERFRYNAEKQELYVFTDFASHQPSCMTCVGIASVVIAGIQRDLKVELSREFPDLDVQLIQA